MNQIELIGQLADLKESNYNLTLLLASLVELLNERQIISKDDLLYRSKALDFLTEIEIKTAEKTF